MARLRLTKELLSRIHRDAGIAIHGTTSEEYERFNRSDGTHRGFAGIGYGFDVNVAGQLDASSAEKKLKQSILEAVSMALTRQSQGRGAPTVLVYFGPGATLKHDSAFYIAENTLPYINFQIIGQSPVKEREVAFELPIKNWSAPSQTIASEAFRLFLKHFKENYPRAKPNT